MTSRVRGLVLTALVAFLAALAGVMLGRTISDNREPEPNVLHEFLHEDLSLDPSQLARIEGLEKQFAVRKGELETELRADNARLAAAIAAERGYGSRVTAEIDRSHHAMGELQKETLSHIFAMRAVLRPDQAEKFDVAVVKALTADEK